MRADSHHRGCRVQSGPGGDVRQQGADGFTGFDQGREQVLGQAEGGKEFGGPLPRDGVEQARGGGVGRFRAADSGEQERDQVRDEQRLQTLQVRLGDELVDGVELQELQARGSVSRAGSSFWWTGATAARLRSSR